MIGDYLNNYRHFIDLTEAPEQKLGFFKRKNSIHPFTTKLSEDEARTVLVDVYDIVGWIANLSAYKST
jgi:ACT domain-containing protein